MKHPQQKLKTGQQTFFAFCRDVDHQDNLKTNQIHYKGKKMYRFIAWQKFLSYFRMVQDPDVEIVEAENKPVQSQRQAS